MIAFDNTEVYGFEHAVRGARNPMNSWGRSDSGWVPGDIDALDDHMFDWRYRIGPDDMDLLKRLRDAGTPDHRKYLRMIVVWVDILAPLYWWKEFDTYKVGTVANSCSTMHKIHAREFSLDDFSHEHLFDDDCEEWGGTGDCYALHMDCTISVLNCARAAYLETNDKKYWWQMIQLLPSSYNQWRTVMLDYEVLANICRARRGHKLDEWRAFCDWVEKLPCARELIFGGEE